MRDRHGKQGTMTPPHRYRPYRAYRSHAPRPACAAVLAGMAMAVLAGCSGIGAPAPGSSTAPTSSSVALAVIQEDSAAEVAAQEQAWADEQARENAIAIAGQTSTTAQAELDQAVAALEAKGASVSYIVMDIATGATIEHNADAIYYSASSIKGPYCVSMVRALGSKARDQYGDTIRACLVNSDNDAYRTLRKSTYGQTFFRDFGAEVGVPIDLSHWYADYSARDLAKLWSVADRWLAAGSEDAVWIGELLGNTLNSQVDDLAGGDSITTWSKAGWYPGGDEGAVTFDGGAVHTQAGDYAIAVAVNRGSNFKAIRSIMEPLIALHDAQATLAGTESTEDIE